jgi:hypothetical protein
MRKRGFGSYCWSGWQGGAERRCSPRPAPYIPYTSLTEQRVTPQIFPQPRSSARQTAQHGGGAAHALTCDEHEREEQAGGGEVGVWLRAHEAAVRERRRGESGREHFVVWGGSRLLREAEPSPTSRHAQVPWGRGGGCIGVDGKHAAGRGRAPVVQRRRNLFEKEQEVIPEKHGSHVLRRGCCRSEHLTQSSCW